MDGGIGADEHARSAAHRFRVVAPYPEGAIVRIARSLSDRGQLEQVMLPATPFKRALVAAGAVGAISSSVVARATRSQQAIAEASYHGGAAELVRMAASHTSFRRLLQEITFRQKRAFGRLAARENSLVDVQLALPGALGPSAKKRAGLAWVYHAVDAHPVEHNAVLLEHFGRAASSELLGAHEVAALEEELHASDIVLVPSRAVERGMRSNGIRQEQLLRVPYGVDFGQFDPGEPGAETRKRPLVIYVGQITYRKGIPFLLDAARGSGVDVHLYGPLSHPRLLEKLPSEVTYKGRVAHAEVQAALRTADALVIPSIEDAFGLVVPEALAAGLPVLSTDAVGAGEDLPQEDQVRVPVGDVSALRAALSAVVMLTQDDRVERARRVRGAAPVLSWSEYGDAVIDGIDARLSGGKDGAH